MRIVRLESRPGRRGCLLAAAATLAVGAVAAVLAIVAPARREEATAVLAIAAALGLGAGAGLLGQAVRTRSSGGGEDLVRLLAPALDDTYLLLLRPRLPGVPGDLEAVLVGPPGIRAVVVRRWHGRYRVRGHGWEFDSGRARGWIPCITNPTFEASAVRNALAGWARGAVGDANLPIESAVAFPLAASRLVLEEPDVEVITTENAPWWANRMGRVQRLGAERVIGFAEAVLDASRAQAERPAGAGGRSRPT